MRTENQGSDGWVILEGPMDALVTIARARTRHQIRAIRSALRTGRTVERAREILSALSAADPARYGEQLEDGLY